ncbi:hypothetical protein [Sporanaerobacter acetigenes]|uniref:hypothetical protein n=1 Tax=Sporanaerobacter acetigenes TaxID=165813 RepID=UPI0013566C3B|nr:hypothetical protein [Sporanaerobacter acetigenes]
MEKITGENLKQILALFIEDIRIIKDNYDIDFFIKSPYNDVDNSASCFSVSLLTPKQVG